MITAHDYKELYRNLDVPIVDDKDVITAWRKVDVHKYLLSWKDNAQGEPEHYNIQSARNSLNQLYSKLHEHFAKAGASLKVYVGLRGHQEKTFNTFTDVWYYARKAYWGKGSPEEVQITLQLAVRFNLIQEARLQESCDEATDLNAQGMIGLDCNGFVGNYIEHGYRGKAWDENKAGHEGYMANTGIVSIMNTLGPEVKTIDDIRFETYVMGLVAPNGQVIDRFWGNSTGHIVITTPFTFFIEAATAFFKERDNKRAIKMRVVESTPNAGLTESDYLVTGINDYVFKVWRGSTNSEMSVRMRPIR